MEQIWLILAVSLADSQVDVGSTFSYFLANLKKSTCLLDGFSSGVSDRKRMDFFSSAKHKVDKHKEDDVKTADKHFLIIKVSVINQIFLDAI